MKERLYTFVDAYRRHLSVAAYVVAAVCVALVTYVGGTYFLGNEKVYAPALETPAKSTTTPAVHLTPSRPVRLIIPKLKIDAPFEILDLNPDKTVGVPKEYTTVGWYSGSKTPGEIGPSVILGHVDSYKGPAVFFYLGRLDKGDTFTVRRDDGSDAHFEVDSLERYSQSDFPTDKVYGPIPFAGIRLITCSGKYDHATKRYSNNLVVYGHLVP
jgi:sortase (surface protein transpeptidase)